MLQLVLVWNATEGDVSSMARLRRLAVHLWQHDGREVSRGRPRLLHSIWANLQTSSGNVILGPDWQHLFGEEHLW